MDVMKWFNLASSKGSKGTLGIEIEAEGIALPKALSYWNVERDGSLVKGKEYVLKEPMTLLGSYKAVKEMESRIAGNFSTIKDSTRAGVHVHVNMQGCSKAQLYNMIVLWCLFEDILLDRCGKYRKGNLFCLPLNKSENVIDALRAVAKDSNRKGGLSCDNLRYCALNVCSLNKFGSLEFRAMRTSPVMMVTYKWAKLLFDMKAVACSYDNPAQIIEEATNSMMLRELYNKVFSRSLAFLGEQPALEASVYKGLLSASSIAYATEDWSLDDVKPAVAVKAMPYGYALLGDIFGDDDDD